MEEFRKGEESCDQALKQVVTEKKNKKSEELENINQCLDVAIDCGISQNSDDYYACTKVFKDEINRWRRGGSRPAGHGRKCGSRR